MSSLFTSDILIYRRTNTGATFQPVWTWSLFATQKGVLDQLTGAELVRNEGRGVDADHVAFIDYIDGVSEEDRIVFDGSAYDIYSIHDPNSMNRHLEIKCEKLKPGIYEDMSI